MDPALRQRKPARDELLALLGPLDPEAAVSLAGAPLPRLCRALEIVRGTGDTLAAWRARPRRPPAFPCRVFVLEPPRAALYERIDRRVDAMLAAGFLDEVAALRAAGITADHASQRAIGYREAHAHLEGRCDREAMAALIKRNTRRYAKRQMTWNRHRFPDAFRIAS